MCAVAFDTGSPTATWNADATALTVTANGKYNYDNTWTFVKLEVYLQYINPNTNAIRNGPSYSVTDESTLATPGTFAVTFNNVAPPQAGENLNAFAKITVAKQGANQSDTTNKIVLVPMKPPPPGGG